MFACELCKLKGILLEKRNLVPHISKKHPDIGTKKYMEMFPDAKLREPPSTTFANKDHLSKAMSKSLSTRTGQHLSEKHKRSIGNSNKSSEKYKLSRIRLSEKFKSGELIHWNKFFISKEELEELYLIKKFSIRKIAKLKNSF